jgi:dethiobiotin synthase
MFRGIFVTGTDTNVGKTVVSAALMLRYRAETRLRYWKPIQTGIEQDDDSAEVARLAGSDNGEVFAGGARLPRPVSPHLAARLAGTRITVRHLVEELRHAQAHDAAVRWIVEGAGGVQVPINERETMADLILALHLPVLVVARSTIGTINHTVLTVEALRRRRMRVAGVVMVGEPDEENWKAIERYGAVEVIAQMPRFDALTPHALAQWVETDFDRAGALFVGGLR